MNVSTVHYAVYLTRMRNETNNGISMRSHTRATSENAQKWNQQTNRTLMRNKNMKRFINRTTMGIQLKRISTRFCLPKVFHLPRNAILFESVVPKKATYAKREWVRWRDLCGFRFTFSLVNPQKRHKYTKKRGSNSGHVWMMTALNWWNSRKTYFLIINPSVINKHDRYLLYPVRYASLISHLIYFVFSGVSQVCLAIWNFCRWKWTDHRMLPNEDISAHLLRMRPTICDAYSLESLGEPTLNVTHRYVSFMCYFRCCCGGLFVFVCVLVFIRCLKMAFAFQKEKRERKKNLFDLGSFRFKAFIENIIDNRILVMVFWRHITTHFISLALPEIQWLLQKHWQHWAV